MSTNGNTVIASQDVDEMIMNVNTTRDRDLSLVFKGVGTGESLTINYTSLQGNTQMAFAAPGNFSWGVKQYTPAYDFRTSSSGAC